MENNQPNYKAIYMDILCTKFPDKKAECFPLLKKSRLSVMDIIDLNIKIFGAQDQQSFEANQKHRSYTKSDILKILDYQKNHKLSNAEVSRHFNMSRNTVAKWRKVFLG